MTELHGFQIKFKIPVLSGVDMKGFTVDVMVCDHLVSQVTEVFATKLLWRMPEKFVRHLGGSCAITAHD